MLGYNNGIGQPYILFNKGRWDELVECNALPAKEEEAVRYDF
jgi:hypothetical protein